MILDRTLQLKSRSQIRRQPKPKVSVKLVPSVQPKSSRGRYGSGLRDPDDPRFVLNFSDTKN